MKSIYTLSLLAALSFVGTRALAASDVSDSQIASIMETANEGEIEAGKLAQTKAQNKEVKAFADHMVTEHSKNQAEGKALAAKLGKKPEATPTTAALKADAAAKMVQLKAAKAGSSFDKTYIDTQVAMHEKVLNELNSTLIPGADTPDMKTFLETTKQHVQMHFDNAKKLQASMK